MSTEKKSFNKGKLAVAIGIITLVCLGYLAFFKGMSKDGDTHYILVDNDDTPDSVLVKLKPVSSTTGYWVYKQVATVVGYGKGLHEGRYSVGKAGALMTFRHIRGGHQAVISITLKSVRTIDDLANDVSRQMMFSKQELLDKLTSEVVCKKYGFTPKTILVMFIPNTYDFYWNTSVDKFLDKISEGSKKFWSFERKQKAKQMKFTQAEVITLASIVDEETDNVDEMPMIAGMYINRLQKDMRLQADPTVKYATGHFTAHRIYQKWTEVDSPYNTYRYKGLPPGPIRIPSVDAIDAVLNYVHHDYMYMCAKEDFSGTHNFAKTYEEHQVNAEKYAKALDERGVK